ncbi:sodium-dependent phosphate transporter 1-A-like isoform X2 [Stegodyphus dumicola]|uniref:sodium-dependent phosphate transporter 1-A-like isoform X2 n=1 Tax=Stegodyphus dumicola TaxID=202533 RepID=UPI0015A885D7|nr:sodium-dependent phosphate transporter 1-A-like isoform X2 [Stegodyphus dumicola]
MFEAYSSDVAWIVTLGFIIAFFLAFGVGANDVANSFGTSVGSKVLTLRQACILATIFEILGALLMGFKVSDTVRKDIFDVSMYDDEQKLLMMGNMAALAGSAVWNILATFLRLPISGTHSIVGAVLGFTFVAKGFRGIQWKTLGFIVSSWFLSPVLSGLVSVLIFVFIRKFILSKVKPGEAGLLFLPFFYGFTVFVNVISVVLDGSPVLGLDRLPSWIAVIISVVIAVTVAIVIRFYVVPKERKRAEATRPENEIPLENPISSVDNFELNDSNPEVAKLFKSLQVMTAIFGSFAHGGNDVSGFTIEIGSATTVLMASKIGLPISTTHCKVGSVVFVGFVRARSTKEVDLKLFRNIVLAWLVTLPFTALLSAFVILILYTTTVP